MSTQPLETDEAIRRIQERDHVLAPHGRWMRYNEEQAIIDLLRTGELICGLQDDGQLAFGPGPNHPANRRPT